MECVKYAAGRHGRMSPFSLCQRRPIYLKKNGPTVKVQAATFQTKSNSVLFHSFRFTEHFYQFERNNPETCRKQVVIFDTYFRKIKERKYQSNETVRRLFLFGLKRLPAFCDRYRWHARV